jgi:hypothetical protein
VNIIKIKKINKINFISSSTYVLEVIDCSAVSLIKVITNIVRDENIEDRDEYLNINETVNHVNINKIPNGIDKASKIPRYVATPLPPLNFTQTGKTCPKKASRHDN